MTRPFQGMDVEYFASDYWKSYEEFIPKNKHLQTKAETYTVEGYNSRIRHYLASVKLISYDYICMDNWDSFLIAFKTDNHLIGKDNTVGIEGNNCRLRHRIRRACRKTGCFSKKIIQSFESVQFGFLLY